MKTCLGKIKTLLLIVLLCSLIISFQQFNVRAQTAATLREKASSFLTDVLGLDLSRYNVTVYTGPSAQPMPFNVSSPFTMEGVDYSLTSNSSTINIGFSFENGFLNLCFIDNIQGSPSYVQQPPTTPIDYTKSFMQKYESYIAQNWNVNVSYLQSANNLITTASENNSLSLVNGNVKFESSPDSIFNWTYTQNGVDVSAKRVELDFTNGTLYSLYDGWNIYSVGSTNYISKDQAISLALPVAENFTLRFTQQNNVYAPNGTVIGTNETEIDVLPDLTNATTGVQFSMSLRNSSSTALYPLWSITFNLYKPIYDVIGITVTVWGDTGQIQNCQANDVLGPLPGSVTNPTYTQSNPTATPTNSATPNNSGKPTNTGAQSGFFGSALPTVYGYALVIAIIITMTIAAIAIGGYLKFRKR